MDILKIALDNKFISGEEYSKIIEERDGFNIDEVREVFLKNIKNNEAKWFISEAMMHSYYNKYELLNQASEMEAEVRSIILEFIILFK